MANSSAPPERDDFEVAILCALKVEYDAVTPLFDRIWDKNYGKVKGDVNTYTTGLIGSHNVVLVLLAGMGKVNASAASANINASFTGIRLALLVGICGGIPTDREGNTILLGDVIVSDDMVQYDLARQFPDGGIPRDALQVERANPMIRTFMNTLRTELHQEELRKSTLESLMHIQRITCGKYNYPGRDLDKLFEPTCRHRHHPSKGCNICNTCLLKSDPTCQLSKELPCTDIQCDEARLVERKPRLSEDPQIHFGRIASGDLVMKSGEDRDKIARDCNAIAFEMEGAGTSNSIPTILIKGVCDYADSHKNKGFQRYAAASAASVMKGLLQQYQRVDRSSNVSARLVFRAKGGIARGGHVDYGETGGGRTTKASITRERSDGGSSFGGHAKGRNSAAGGEAQGGDASGQNATGGDASGGDAELCW